MAPGSGREVSGHPGRSEGNQPPALFVPQLLADATQAFSQGQPLRLGELGVIAQDRRQAVERHSALQVVDVMHANFGAEPAQDAGLSGPAIQSLGAS